MPKYSKKNLKRNKNKNRTKLKKKKSKQSITMERMDKCC